MNVRQPAGFRLVIPFAAGCVSLIGIAGGAAAAHFANDSVSASTELNSFSSTLQRGLESSPTTESSRASAKVTPVSTSVAATPAGEGANSDSPPDPRIGSRLPGALPGSSVAVAAAPVVVPPRSQASPRFQAPQVPPPVAAPPVVATPPAPPQAPPIEVDLIPLKPRTEVQPKQLRFG